MRRISENVHEVPAKKFCFFLGRISTTFIHPEEIFDEFSSAWHTVFAYSSLVRKSCLYFEEDYYVAIQGAWEIIYTFVKI